MSGMTLAKTGKRYTRLEWMAMSSEERDQLLAKSGPAYTDEAWQKHHGVVKNRKR